jgi:FkbM family methyltransferase
MNVDGFYEWALSPGDLAFDVGANLGEHTAAMLNSGARVVALEPQTHLAHELERRFPSISVIPAGASDAPGEATLMTVTGADDVATMNPAWSPAIRAAGHGPPDGTQKIQLTTMDEVIARFGTPAFIKIDTEGFDDKVLAGLSEPVDQLLFEIVNVVPDVALRAFDRLEKLGRYKYRVTDQVTWRFGRWTDPDTILRHAPLVGNVHARRVV